MWYDPHVSSFLFSLRVDDYGHCKQMPTYDDDEPYERVSENGCCDLWSDRSAKRRNNYREN